jgi:hypothetical protein
MHPMMNQDNEITAEVMNVIKFNLIKFSINSINKLCNVITYLSEWNAEVKRIFA